MSLTRYFIHDFWTAREFNDIEAKMKERSRAQRAGGRRAAQEREELRTEVDFLALALVSLVRSLVEKGVLTPGELRAHMRALDAEDGAEDGRIDPSAARASLGVPPPPMREPPAPKPRAKRRGN